MAERTIALDQWDASEDGWRASLPLTSWPEDRVTIDARAVRFVTPTFLLRLRSFIDWHRADDRVVTVLCPRRSDVANYVARMRLGEGLPGDVLVGLPQVRERDRRDVLIPITRLRTDNEVEELNEAVAALMQAHDTDVAVLEAAMAMAISELCGNAIEHGENPLGCYVAAQRYKRHTVLTIGDLGCGIPKRIRGHFQDVRADPEALELALREGVTTTGRTSRGQGFYWVMEEAQQSRVRMAKLDRSSTRLPIEDHFRR